MSQETQQRERCLFPINPDGKQVSHPVIGSLVQCADDFETIYEPMASSIKPLIEIQQTESDMGEPLLEVRLLRNDFRVQTELKLIKRARNISVVVPRDLLASDALSLFDLRLFRSHPSPIGKHIIDTVEILVFLLGDGIANSWRGKLEREKTTQAEKDYWAKIKLIEKLTALNKSIQERNDKKQEIFENKLLKWQESSANKKKKTLKRSRKQHQEEEEEEEEEEEPSGSIFEEAEERPPTIREPTMEELRIIPPFPQKPFILNDELERLLIDERLTILGGPGDRDFMVRDEFQQTHLFPRVFLDIEHLFKEDHNNQASALIEHEPVAYILHFTVLDPRISILKGMDRLISRNLECTEERNRRTRLKDENTRLSRSRQSNLFEKPLYDRREHSAVEAIVSWEEWKQDLYVCSASPERFNGWTEMTTMDTARTSELSYLDPFCSLDPKMLFDYTGTSDNFNFNLLVANQELSTLEKAAWNLNMSADFDFVSTYSNNRQLIPWSAVVRYGNDFTARCHLYRNPYAVVRVMCRDLHHVATLDSILPNFVKGSNKRNYYRTSVKGILFPPLSCADTVSIRQRNEEVSKSVMRGSAEKDTDLSETICENIASFYYDKNNELKGEYRGTTDLANIKEDLFTKAFRGLASHSPKLPCHTKDVARYHDNITSHGRTHGGIFPEIDCFLKKSPYVNTTFKACQFLQWWNREFIEGPNISQIHSHNIFMFIFAMIPLQFTRTPTQSMIVLFGPPGTGKTFIMKPFEKYLIPGTFNPVDTFSNMAFNTGDNRDGGISYTDDAGKEDPLFKFDAFGKKPTGNDFSGQLKTMLTKGYLARQIVDTTNGRAGLNVKTSLRFLHVKLTNYQLKGNCEPAVLDRSFLFHVPPPRRRGGVSQVQQQYRNISAEKIEKNNRATSIIISRFQIFSAYIGYFIGCNAIRWDPLIYMWGFSIYWNKFTQCYAQIHGHGLSVTSRFSDDRLKNIAYGCAVLRVWLDQAATVGLDYEFDKGFDFEVFKTIEKNQELVVSQDDFIHAMSFIEDMLPGRCYTHVVRWVLKHLTENGYDPARSNLEQGDYWLANPRFFYNTAVGGMSGQTDVNYLDLNISAASKKEVIEEMSDLVDRRYNRFFFNHGEIISQFYSLLHGDDSEGVSAERHHFQPYLLNNGALVPTTKTNGDVLKIEKRGEVYHAFILRAWVDDWVKDPRSFFYNSLYQPTEGFMTSPIFATLKHMFDFKGALPGTFALPGMNLSKIAETQEAEDDIRPYELMTITIKQEDLTELVVVGDDAKTRFPRNIVEIPGPDGKYQAYFQPTDDCQFIDTLASLKAMG